MAHTDANGRRLVFALHSADIDKQSFTFTDIPRIFLDITGLVDAPNFDANLCTPITSSKVTKLVKSDNSSYQRGSRYSGTHKPVLVQADVNLDDFRNGRGEKTSSYSKLAEIIRNRGRFKFDDCGHIVGSQFGGKMLDYNLFPQDHRINRGTKGCSRIWKWGIELLVSVWMIFQSRNDPMVCMRLLLLYSDREFPDRPSGIHYHLQFYKRDGEEKPKVDKDDLANCKAIREFVRCSISLGVANDYCFQNSNEEAKRSVNALKDHLRQLKEMASVPDLRKMLELIIDEIDLGVEIPRAPAPMSANKPFSGWDLVPVVGSLRTLDDAVRCGRQGDGIGVALNTALGLGGLALDVLTLGTISMFGKAAGTAAKEGAKIVAKEEAKQAVKAGSIAAAERVVIIAVEEILKEGEVALIQTFVAQAARRGIQNLVKLA